VSERAKITQAIERYLRSGEYEHDHPEWSGQNIMEKSKNGHDDHLRALVAEVKRRSKGRTHAPVPELDLASWTRRKLTPMVHGFFPEAEREAVLRLFERSVVFLTSDNIESVLLGQMWLAYSCEAYGWIVERASSKSERLALGDRFAAHGFGQCDESMDPDEVTDIVREACHARSGWKVILGRCAPEKRLTRRSSAVMSTVE